MADQADQILIVSTIGGRAAVAADAARPERGVSDKLAAAVRAVNASTVRDNMAAFFAHMREIINSGADQIGAFQVSEVEVSAQITADGQVALLGSGARFEAQGGLKFIFKRGDGASPKP